MAYCQVCKTELSQEAQSCYVCGNDLASESSTSEEWLVLGVIDDKLHADLAKETLESCKIPAVVVSKSGFFGNIGLFFNPFYSNASPAFEVSVPVGCLDEATAVLESTLGEKFHRMVS